MPGKITLFIFLVIFAVILYGLGKQIYEALQAGKRLDQEVEAVVKLQQKNAELKKKLTESESLAFIEEQARNKLQFARLGESVIIIPQEVIDRIIEAEKPVHVVQVPNWQGWLKLFWH